jgi:hypothetical protein
MALYGTGTYDSSTYDSGGENRFVYPHGQTPMIRIGKTDRVIGEIASAPEGFKVYNTTTTNKVFTVSSGVWIDGGAFDPLILSEWRLS